MTPTGVVTLTGSHVNPIEMVTDGSGAYLLANAVGFASGQPPGGHIDHYVIGTGGLLTAVSTTTVAGSLPTSMTLVAAH